MSSPLQSSEWRARGRVFLWRYCDTSHGFRGWHLSADDEGCAALLELFAAWSAESARSSHIIPLTTPTPAVIAVPGYRAHWEAPARWRITYSPDESEAQAWRFPRNLTTAELELGSESLARLAAGVADIRRGEGDETIGGEEQEAPSECSDLWFWWQPMTGS